MDLIQAIGLVGGIASIAGLLYAFYYARQSRRVKLLAYEATGPVPLATAVSPEDDYSLSVLFKKAGQAEELIEGVQVQFVRFANLGKEPIRRADIAPSNPLRVKVRGSRVLDISMAGSNRSVTNIDLGELLTREDYTEAHIGFDFLDFQDGGLVKILTSGGRGSVQIVGDIIGMPLGIKRISDIKPRDWLGGLGCFLSGLLELLAFGAAALIFHSVIGSWSLIWLLLLPIVALILPLIIIAVVGTTVWPDEKPALPESLALPRWYYALRLKHNRLPPDVADIAEDDLRRRGPPPSAA